MNLNLSDPVELGKQLRQLRKRRKLTQVQVYLITHIPQTTLSNYENGMCAPRAQELVRLLNCYGYNLSAVVKPKALRYVPALPPPGQPLPSKPVRPKARKQKPDAAAA